LQMKACATAADNANRSNEDDTTACLVVLVYLFARPMDGSLSNSDTAGRSVVNLALIH
jgi:hypothetical protein